MNTPAPALIHLVDDDPSVLRSLGRVLETEGFSSRGHANANALLAGFRPTEAGCVVVDLGLPDLCGLDLQERLALLDPDLPVVVLTGQGDIPLSVRAMKAGALNFLTKPVDVPALLATLREALARRARTHLVRHELADLRARLTRLTSREAEVLGRVAQGLLNKQIAADLGIAEKTVKIHRAHGLAKLGVHSIPALMAYAPHLPAAPSAASPPTTAAQVLFS